MKTNDKKQLHQKTVADINEALMKAREVRAKLVLDQSQGKLKNTGSLRNARKEIAILATILREKELKGAEV